MRLMLALLAFLVFPATTATAQEYKCQNGGKVYLAQYPCPGFEAKDARTTTAPIPSPRSVESTPSAAQALANSPIVRQSNGMIAAALAERDFAKAERLAVTKEQWEMIDAAKRQARKEWADAEFLAVQRNAQESAKRVAADQRKLAEANAAAAQANAAAAEANARRGSADTYLRRCNDPRDSNCRQ